MTTDFSIRSWRIAYCLCTLVTALSTNQFASAQCCGGMRGFTSEMMAPGMIIEGDSIYLTVNLPDAAVLKVNDDPTISLGPTRYFVVRGLEQGKTYTFDIVAETLNPAGVALLEKKTLKLQPGANEIITLKPVKRKVPRPKPDAKADEDKDADKKDSDKKEPNADKDENAQMNSPLKKARQI